MKIFGVGKIGPKGQVVIPSEARKQLNLNPGNKVMIVSLGEKGIMILPIDEVKKQLSTFENLLKSQIKNLDSDNGKDED